MFGPHIVIPLICLFGLIPPSTQHNFDSKLNEPWYNYKAVFDKRYSNQEELQRRSIWEKNVDVIQQHNLHADMGHFTYWLGINKYADWSNEEIYKYLANYRAEGESLGSAHFLAPNYMELPDEVDWRKEGYVTPVKDQGKCGSCWTFSTTGTLEGQHYRATGKLVSLSEQQLVDCTTSYGNYGCNGGWKDRAFQYIKDTGGIDTEIAYPYLAHEEKCHFNRSGVGATCTGFTDLPKGDELALKQATASVGPVSVAIEVSGNFVWYRSGVYDNPNCTHALNHAVLVVGYGAEQGRDYWLVKNSWSSNWGEEGYIKMSRNNDNQCGIANQASYPLV